MGIRVDDLGETTHSQVCVSKTPNPTPFETPIIRRLVIERLTGPLGDVQRFQERPVAKETILSDV